MRITTTGALATVAVTALIVTSPIAADAARIITGAQIKDGTVTSADVKDRSLLAKDFKAGQLPKGPQGEPGAPGPSGVIDTQMLGGMIDTLPATNNDVVTAVTLAFTGDPATVTLPENSTIIATGTQVLGTSGNQGPIAGPIAFALCATQSEQPMNGANVIGTYLVATATATPTAFATSGAGNFPAGRYRVGTCADPGTTTLDTNDYVSGTVQVVKSADLVGAAMKTQTNLGR